jgi:hypothetical protein
MWFTFIEGQLGFAFSNYPIDMLWNRDIFNRVRDILIPGLKVDPASYLASDGENLYFVTQVYIDYPLQSGFAASPYLRFFGVVLVNVYDGSMQGYTVSDAIGADNRDFLTTFFHEYYSSWQEAPSWLIRQLRYPEQLLGTSAVPGQLDHHFIYHVDDPFAWRSGSQFYERPTNNVLQYIPWSVGNTTHFVGMQLVDFVGATSKNLAGLYIAYGGDRLGQIDFLQNPSPNATFIGPEAADNALTTNQQVRTQLTLLPNYRKGSYVLYSVGGNLEYFVPVYTAALQGVVAKLTFIATIDPITASVAIGTDAATSYLNLVETANNPSSPESKLFLNELTNLITSLNYRVVNATSVSTTVFIKTDSLTLGGLGRNQTIAKIAGFLGIYGPGSVANTVYMYIDTASNLNIGVVKVPATGVTEFYYLTVAFGN